MTLYTFYGEKDRKTEVFIITYVNVCMQRVKAQTNDLQIKEYTIQHNNI